MTTVSFPLLQIHPDVGRLIAKATLHVLLLGNTSSAVRPHQHLLRCCVHIGGAGPPWEIPMSSTALAVYTCRYHSLLLPRTSNGEPLNSSLQSTQVVQYVRV